MPKTKPPKPYPAFPLYAHNNGKWCKRVGRKFHYFGSWADWQGALAEYNKKAEFILKGENPPEDEPTVASVGNAYFTAKAISVECGELTKRAFDEYKAYYQLAVECFGGSFPVRKLTSDHFLTLKAKAAKRGVAVMRNVIRRVKMVFTWAYDEGKISEPVKFGKEFSRRSKRSQTLSQVETAERMFEAAEIRMLLEKANVHLKAAILLGINCAYGQADVAALPFDKLDLENGWVMFPRPKTGTPRRCPLWPETVEAIKVAIKKRYKHKSKTDENLVFISKQGNKLVRYDKGCQIDGIGQTFIRLVKNNLVKREKVAFYSLRRTFRTIADEVQDTSATALIMGHTENTMGALYTQRIKDERLKAVTDYVHGWLWPKEAGDVPEGSR